MPWSQPSCYTGPYRADPILFCHTHHRGRAEVVKLICSAKNVPFEVVDVDFQDMKTDRPAYPFGQCEWCCSCLRVPCEPPCLFMREASALTTPSPLCPCRPSDGGWSR